MNLDNFNKEKRAALQKQAYGKVYAHCDICYMPLIPTSKVIKQEDEINFVHT